jgi:hypothetical protein
MKRLDDVGLVVSTQLTDDTPIWLVMFAAKVSSEELGFMQSGTEHGTHKLKAEATPHPAFPDPFDAATARICLGGILWGNTP